jgi:flavorubredoxin
MANKDFVVKLDSIVKKYSTRKPASPTTLHKSRPKINRKVGKSQNLNIIKNEISISRAKAICSKEWCNENISGYISGQRKSCRHSSDIVKRASEEKLQLGKNRANFIRSLMSQSKEDINHYFSNSVILFDDIALSKLTNDGKTKT